VGHFAGSVIDETKYYTIENDLVKIKISNLGAQPFKVELKNFKTFDSLPLILFDSLRSDFGLNFFAGRRQINTAVLYFKPEPGKENQYHYKVSGDSTLSFALRLYADSPDSLTPSNSYIEYRYTLKGNEYMLGYNITCQYGKSIRPHSLPLQSQLEHRLVRQEKIRMKKENNLPYITAIYRQGVKI
jgi:YidC/Oxa1 family membrane protein insertase